jgi:two-component system cell cycle response regulator DivK
MGKNILCIEDNPDNMLLLRRILQSSGYDLLLANKGLEGVNLAETEDVDLILLDINLPDIDGYEVTRRLRASQKRALAHTPIIVISANALKGDAQKALSAGCNLYLTKPIDIHELSERVESYLPSLK